ncbi:MAG: hypothetical protein JNK76_03710 [Planctomycetales bacterium]|nr:hypothetical protein [Planctomycetales bacterium]
MTDVPLHIQRRADGSWIEAQILEGVKPPDLIVVEGEWAAERSQVMQELLKQGVPRPNWPQSLHWDWRKKAPQLKLLASAGFGLVSEKRWQGVMLTLTEPYATQLNQDKGKPLLYIDYLEIAPWNWAIPAIGQVGQFRGIGSILFWKAIRQSQEEGFHGRVGLHALPQAESFYEKICRMTPLGRDPSKQNLLYLELSRIEAERHLKEDNKS